MFSPSEILSLVLSFCVLWLTAALFWFIWQAAQILRNVNTAVDEAREKIGMIEHAITGMRNRLDSMTAPATILMEGAKKVIEYAMDKRRDRKD
ncbi:MAG: hypothetical protein WCO25_02530 [Candidatus Uhrbacteria bacterium]